MLITRELIFGLVLWTFFVFKLLAEPEAYAATIELVKTTPAPPQLHFQSAQTCATCHQAIYAEWQQSWMAKAYTNGVFQEDFQRWRTYAQANGEHPDSCLRCHAPVALLDAELDVRLALMSEGVTCEVCHKVAKVRALDNRFHLVMDPRNIQYSTLASKETKAHGIRPSHAFKDSQLCAGCHLDVQAAGIHLERTYQEWLDSSYAEQEVACKACHMPLTPGAATNAPGVAASVSHASHQFHGGHSTSPLLEGAADLTLNAFNGKDRLAIDVTNTSVGHNFPTGGAHPAELRLELKVMDVKGQVIHTDHRVYAVQSLNAQGEPVGINQLASAVQDLTLRAQETRTESFAWVSSAPPGQLEASLVYHLIPSTAASVYSPEALRLGYNPVVVARCTIAVFPASEITQDYSCH